MATNVDAKLLKQTKFPPEFSQKVDMKKVNVEVMKKWIAGKISEILGSEDDVVVELCFNLLERSRYPDIKVLQIQLTGFLEKDTAKFCKELWTLCLSAQSNPQGVPKELLEAKKLELIQEKVSCESRPRWRMVSAKILPRLTPRKLPRKPCAGRSKNEHEIGISTTSGSESELNGGVAVEEVTEDITTTTDVHVASQGLLHHDANPPLTEATIVDPRQGTMSTHIFLATKMGGDMTIVVVRLLFDDPRTGPCPGRGPPQGAVETTIQGPDVAGTVLADRQRLFVAVAVENESRGFMAVAVIVPEPIHLQTHLAHDHPEDSEGDTVLHHHPVVLLLHRGRNMAGMGTLRSPRLLCLGLVLIRSNEIAGRLVGREDLRLTLVMKWMIHALMLAKDEATTTVDIKLTAVTARERKRRRSIERYAPAARRRRNTSSVSSPVGKRHKTADSSEEEANRQPREPISRNPENVSTTVGRNEEVGSDS
ncbi:MAG: hypothetical protein Q9224_003058 [Gallowayella concinna]